VADARKPEQAKGLAYGDDPAVTLHVYSPPLARMGAYTIADDGVLQRRAMPSSQELRPQERDDDALPKRCDAA
jgi:hypothetical protein